MPKTHKRLTVPINDLALDTDNPRIISQEDEKSCIETMLNMNEVYILNLAEDIAKNGLKNKDIIVKKGTGAMKCKYIVRDGNRRITSIKLLNDPTKVPNSRFTEKFSKIKKQYNNFPKAIECDVYADETEIMEVLLSRHAGSPGVRLNIDAATDFIEPHKLSKPTAEPSFSSWISER